MIIGGIVFGAAAAGGAALFHKLFSKNRQLQARVVALEAKARGK